MMTLFDPFADLTRLRRQIERSVDDAISGPRQDGQGRFARPAADIFESEEGFTVRLDLPGIDRSSIDVQLVGEELVIRAERKWVKPEKGACVHAERPYGEFTRVFRVGVPVKSEGVQALYRDGVLTVELPKADTVKPRRIEVQSSGE